MNKRLLMLAAALLVTFTSCSEEDIEPAHLQFISMIPEVDDAGIEITPVALNEEEAETLTLEYAEPSGYHTYAPGKYEIIYKTGSTPLLKHTIVLGKKSYQTLVASGLLPDSLSTNPRTTMYTIKRALAGSESYDTNGYMPQFIMLRDLYRGKREESMLRLMNASPFAKSVTLKQNNKNLATVEFPLFKEPFPVESGGRSYKFFLGDVKLADENFTLEKGYIHTFITGNSTSSGSSLTIVSYKTASGMIREE